MNTNLFLVLMINVGTLYVVTLGMGMLVGGWTGFNRVHQWWMRALTRAIAWILNTIGDLLRWLARSIRR